MMVFALFISMCINSGLHGIRLQLPAHVINPISTGMHQAQV